LIILCIVGQFWVDLTNDDERWTTMKSDEENSYGGWNRKNLHTASTRENTEYWSIVIC
jgi:hypothetical protein